MKNYNWIILKSELFELEDITIGRVLAFSELKNKLFMDYQYSHGKLEKLASLFVMPPSGIQMKNADLLWQEYNKSKTYCYELLDDDVVVGVLMILSKIDYDISLAPQGVKLNQAIKLLGTQKSKVDQKMHMVVNLTALGLNTKEISELLYLTNRGVDYHIEKAKRKLGANNKANLVFKASQYGWI